MSAASRRRLRTPSPRTSSEPLPDPTTLVIFGAGGDLAARKLIPAVYNLVARRACFRDQMRVIGVARRHDLDVVSPDGPRGDRGPLPHRVRRGCVEGAGAAAGDHPGRLREPQAVRGPGRSARARRCPPGPTQRVFYLAVAPELLRADRQGAGRRGLGGRRRPAHPPDDREAVRPRPRLGAGAERRDRIRFRRVAGVSPRPLPGQGDGPEPPGAAVRATASWSRSGTAAMSSTCRSRWRRSSASATAPPTTTPPGRSAT